jgi:hypothetical protein
MTGDRQVKRAHLGAEFGPTWVEKGFSPIVDLVSRVGGWVGSRYFEAEALAVLPLAFIDSRKR